MGNRHYRGVVRGAPAVALGCVLAAVLAGCGGRQANVRTAAPAAWADAAPADPAAANAVLMRALSLVGAPYRYGGASPDTGFDCSGLVGYVFRDMLGHALPRTTGELGRSGDRVAATRLAAGDLVVFGRGQPNHVGIYVGEGRFVHAPTTGGRVRIDRLDGPYWRDHLLGGRRLLP